MKNEKVVISEYWNKCKTISEKNIHDDDFYRQFHKKSEKFYSFTYIERLFPLIIKIKKNHTVMELGCGTGIDANLFSYFGKKIIGLDITKERIDVSNQLKNILKRKNVQFYYRDIFSFLEDNRNNYKRYFDFIWITEAISHIHPLEELFPLLYDILKDDGYLVISESNILNPIFKKHIFKERISRYHKINIDPEKYKVKDFYLNPRKFIDPKTKKEFFQANERMLAPTELKKMLKSFDFKVKKIYFKAYLPEKLFNILPFSFFFEHLFSIIPFIRRLGIRYILFAKKNGV